MLELGIFPVSTAWFEKMRMAISKRCMCISQNRFSMPLLGVDQGRRTTINLANGQA
jgi:hypothetical protein